MSDAARLLPAPVEAVASVASPGPEPDARCACGSPLAERRHLIEVAKRRAAELERRRPDSIRTLLMTQEDRCAPPTP